MSFNLAIILPILFTLVQGETVDQVVAELRPKVDQLQTRIGLIISNGGTLIGTTRATISRSVAVAENSIAEQIDQLGTIIDEARASDTNQLCIDNANAALLQLNLNGLNQCRSSSDLDLLGIKLGNLGTVKGQLAQAIALCTSSNPTDAAALRSCIQGKISSAETEANRIEDNINTTCDNAKKNSAACVELTLGDVDLGIDKIAHDLQKCISN